MPSPEETAQRQIEAAVRTGTTKLNLSGLGLTTLPDAIAQLTNLEVLDLSSNQLNSLPDAIARLTNLNVLDLSSNQLNSLPDAIAQLTNLEVLLLRSNQLNSLLDAIVQLTNLEVLDLSNNQLNSLPDAIAQLTNLKVLYLHSNQLSNLPNAIAQLTNLEVLYLSDTQLSSLPNTITRLINLKELYLSNNQWTSLPRGIVQLVNLKVLNLSNTQLSSLPDAITQLANLKVLNLSNTQLSSLPDAIAQLTNLEVLYLSNTQLSNLPNAIVRLTNLKELYLSNNQWTNLPDAIAQLTTLKELHLNNNQLSGLPNAIAQLTHLEVLNLRNNQLNSLPNAIAQLTNLKRLVLDNNPLPIPPEVIRKGWGDDWYHDGEPKAVLDYYVQIEKSQTSRPLNEVKVLLVGEGDVGKTSLLERLINNRFNHNERKTEGINIQTWSLPVQGQEVRLNLWDFGGQEIMHATHQFFLTKRSIYLLVLDNRQSEQQNRLEYWLKVIQSFGVNSPIILVGNHLDEHALDLNQRALHKKYKTIQAIISTSCKDGRGIEDLRRELIQQITRLAHVSDRLPLPWFTLKTQLEEMQKTYDFISYERYQKLCGKAGIDKLSDQKTLVQFLHDLGIVLNFQDDPRVRETNVLNPEWVTTGVYKILNNNALLTKHKGILDQARLPQILNNPQRYPEEKYGFLINLMRKFELCFDLEGAIDSRFLIPDLLPKEESETGDWDNAMRFEYRYIVLPSSIISRFIVRTNRLISRNTYWRTGVVLKQGNTRALVRADEEDRKITIWLMGSQPRTLLEIIRSNFDAIHDTIPSIEVEERLGLPDNGNLTVAYQHLLDLEAVGELEVFPEGARKKYNVRDLLNGIEDAASRGHRRDRLEHREQYLAKLEAEREAMHLSKTQSSRPTLLSSSVVMLGTLGAIAAIFAVLAHSVPGLNLVIVIVAILIAFGGTVAVVLRLTGIIDNTTFSGTFSNFWSSLPLLRGDASPKELPPGDSDKNSTPKS